jgi:hypothetical protein
MTSGAAAWTTVADVISRLRSRWMGGRYLAAYASGGEWQPVSFPIRGPAAGELLERLDEVQNWLTRVNRDLRRFPGLRVEAKAIQGRRVGSNEIPARLWVDSYAALFQILGVSDKVAEFDELARLIREVVPELTDWVASHPRTVLEHSSIWPRLVSVVRWIADRDVSMLYARQVDVAGVDTKLIEQYKLILGRLLEAVLPGDHCSPLLTLTLRGPLRAASAAGVHTASFPSAPAPVADRGQRGDATNPGAGGSGCRSWPRDHR